VFSFGAIGEKPSPDSSMGLSLKGASVYQGRCERVTFLRLTIFERRGK